MFYKNLKKELQALIAKKEYNKALEIINQELAMPYVPKDFESYLLEIKKELSEKSAFQSSPIKQLTIEEIKTKLLSDDLLHQSMAIQNLATINVRSILEPIEQYLTKKKVLASNKTLVLMVLHEQQVAQKINVKKNRKLFQVVPKELNVDSIYLEFKQISTILEKLIGDKNPSLLNNAVDFALVFLMNYFPKKVSYQTNDLTAAIFAKSRLSLGLDVNWEELRQVFSFDLKGAQKILKDQEQYEQDWF